MKTYHGWKYGKLFQTKVHKCAWKRGRNNGKPFFPGMFVCVILLICWHSCVCSWLWGWQELALFQVFVFNATWTSSASSNPPPILHPLHCFCTRQCNDEVQCWQEMDCTWLGRSALHNNQTQLSSLQTAMRDAVRWNAWLIVKLTWCTAWTWCIANCDAQQMLEVAEMEILMCPKLFMCKVEINSKLWIAVK